jgi:aquaporin Z
MKRYVMECIGTFFLTVAISLIANPFAIGLMLMAMIYVGGHVSGAHFNPAITFGCLIQNRINAVQAGKYAGAQVVGALLALCFFALMTNSSFVIDEVPGEPMLPSLAMEALLVLVFVWVYLSINTLDRYKNTFIGGIVMGLTLLAMTTARGVFNPAVATASLLCNAVRDGGSAVTIGSIVIYIVGPLLGALAASCLFDYFKTE